MSCGCKAMAANGDPAGRSITALGGVTHRRTSARKKGRMAAKKKATKRKSKGKGAFCVYSPKGKLFRCFESKDSAERMAKGACKRSKGWRVGRRK